MQQPYASNTSPLTNLSATGLVGLVVIWAGAKRKRSPWTWGSVPVLSSWMNGKDGTRPTDWNSVSPESWVSCWKPSHGARSTQFAHHLDALRHKAGFYLAEQVHHSALALSGESDM